MMLNAFSPLILQLLPLHLFSLLLIVFLLHCIVKILYHMRYRATPTAQIPPGSLGFPFIGETLQFLSAANNSTNGFYDFVRTRRLKYGNCFKTNIFGETHVFMSSSTESAKAVLGSDFVNFRKRYIRSIAELIGEQSLLLCASQEQHRLLRNRLIAADLVSTSSMSSFIRHFDESITKTLTDWGQRGTVVVFQDALQITFKAMCKMLMSVESKDELEILGKEVDKVCEALLAFPLKLPGTRFFKGIKARKIIMYTLKKMMNQRRRRQVAEEERPQDLMQSLLDGSPSNHDHDDDPHLLRLTDTQIQDNILTLIIAGQVTTASAMTWMVKYLDENQELQDTLRDEQIKLARNKAPHPGSPSAGTLTLEDLNEMSHASKVVKETLRMASIVPWLPRVALNDCEIEGFRIKKGWIVNIDARSIHLDPMVYHDPTRFHPLRFDDDQSTPYSFLAFGTGGRTCLGMNLAKAMMIVFLHRLITTYRWKVMDSDTKLEKRALFSRLRSGCPIRVTPVKP